MAKTQMTTTVK